jgi:hypothetical protein
VRRISEVATRSATYIAREIAKKVRMSGDSIGTLEADTPEI